MAGNDFDEITVRGLIDDALGSTTLYPLTIPTADEMYFGDNQVIDLTSVFYNGSTSEIVYEVFDVSTQNVVAASIDGTNLVIDALNQMESVEITIRATVPEKESFIKIKIDVYDSSLETSLFESFEGSFTPSGWTLQTDGAGWQQSTSTGYTGSSSAYHADNNYTDGAKEDWLWSQPVHINGTSTLTFWQKSDYADYRDIHAVAISLNLNRWTWLDTDLSAGSAWDQISYDLSGYDGQDIYIGFYYKGDYADIWYVDDVRVWTTTGINDQPMIVNGNTLYQNYPNPFNPSTEIKFNLVNNSNVKLDVYNSNGEVVSSLVNSMLEKGSHSISFNASEITGGIYFYQLEVDGKSMTKKMLLLK